MFSVSSRPRGGQAVSSTPKVIANALLSVSASSYTDVNVSRAKQMIESDPNLTILDVRTQAEYDSGHIQNATLIPVTELAGRLGELNRERETLVYCGSGGRSATASQMLVDNGFSKVYNMLGGITAWRNAGYWIEIIHNGDLIIDGTQTFVIENCSYIQTGNICVKDYGTLIMREAELFLNQSRLYEYQMRVEDNGQWSSSNATISSNYNFNQDFGDSSAVNFIRTHWTSFTWINGYGSFLSFNESNDSIGDISVSTQMLFVDSSASTILALAGSSVKIENSTMLFAGIGARYSELHVDNLGAGHISVFNTFKNLTIAGGSVASLDVLNSDMSLSFQLWESNLTVSNSSMWGVEAGLSKILINHSNGTRNGGFSLHADNSEAQIYGSLVHFVVSDRNSSFSLYNCTVPYGIHFYGGQDQGSCFDSRIGYIVTQSFGGTLAMSNCTILGGPQVAAYLNVFDSEFYLSGSVSFPSGSYVRSWRNSTVTRNLDIVVMNGTGHPAADVEIALLTQNYTTVWGGFADSFGRTSINLTFADNNYTDTLRLEATKGDYSAEQDVGFLFDTPVILKMRYFADLDGDGKVSILDISIVAYSFGCKREDARWNEVADLNKDGVVNILDITRVAKDFGRTV
jgi:rhodanese-related sulfurtransferase